ncbi:MAG: thermonuclease family protein [Rhodovarius sp.]|nr:thermonuclease family protein [Rhodovarius sp.]
MPPPRRPGRLNPRARRPALPRLLFAAALLLLLGAAGLRLAVERGGVLPERGPAMPEEAAREGSGEPPARLAGPAEVVDADTILLAGRLVRLEAIDAPERRQPCWRADGSPWACGEAAAEALTAFLRERPVVCTLQGSDRFARLVGRCEADGEDIQAWLVREGWALAYSRYSDRYRPEEEEARRQGPGMWQGPFDPPEEWRRREGR